jgi:peptidoglycan/LPS O-acetylase OafA/YrhL
MAGEITAGAKLQALTGLRFVAAAMILVHHATFLQLA